MDNDNKISIFLDDESLKNGKLLSELEKARMYDLEKEYAKTKKNKFFKNYIIAAATVLVIIGISLGITSYIDHKYSTIEVDIDVFEDLNLKNLLNMVGQVQNNLASVRNEKRSLEANMANEINNVDLKLEAEKALILKKRILPTEKQKQIAQAEQNALNEKEKIRREYESKIAPLRITISDLEEELAKYESSNLEKAQEQKNILDSERQLFDLEKQAQKNEYDAVIEDLRERLVRQQEQAVIDQKRAVELAIKEYQERIEELDPVVPNENVAEATLLDSGMEGIKTISDYVKSVPYENNLGEYVVSMEKIAKSRISELEKVGSLVTYFDSLHAARLEKANVDGFVISRSGLNSDEKYFVCYLTPKARSLSEKRLRASVKVSDNENCILLLDEACGFFIGVNENKYDFDRIPLNANLVLE